MKSKRSGAIVSNYGDGRDGLGGEAPALRGGPALSARRRVPHPFGRPKRTHARHASFVPLQIGRSTRHYAVARPKQVMAEIVDLPTPHGSAPRRRPRSRVVERFQIRRTPLAISIIIVVNVIYLARLARQGPWQWWRIALVARGICPGGVGDGACRYSSIALTSWLMLSWDGEVIGGPRARVLDKMRSKCCAKHLQNVSLCLTMLGDRRRVLVR